MISILRRRGLRVPPKGSIFIGAQFCDPQIALFVKSFSSEKLSPDVCKNDPEQSFTVSYLINSCGLSSKDALVASRKLRFKSTKKPDEVLDLLRKYGFTDAHIPRLVTRWPLVLVACPKKNLLPKLEFFRSIGVPLDVLALKLCFYPLILHRSLECYLMPFYNFLKDIVQSDKRVVAVFSRAPRAFAHGWQREVSTNIATLRERGLPESSIAMLIAHHPKLLVHSEEKLTGYVDRAVAMGFDMTKVMFVHALLVFGEVSDSNLKHRMDVCRRYGWSESDVNAAFLKHPIFVKYSAKKIIANMEFLVNKMGFEPGAIAQCPLLLGFSLEKRIKPRCWIVGILNAKGLLNRKMSPTKLLIMPEEKFLKRYIVGYQDVFPQLSDIYQGKLSLPEIGFSEEEIEKILFRFFKHDDTDS